MKYSNYVLNDCDVRNSNTPITFVKTEKFLGITIDDRLNYNEHVMQLTKDYRGVKVFCTNYLIQFRQPF